MSDAGERKARATLPRVLIEPAVLGERPIVDLEKRDRLFAAIERELARAYSKHGAAAWGRHEFYAILKEEIDELWDAIKTDGDDWDLLAELVSVAAMCARYYETGDRYRGALPLLRVPE